MDPVRPMTDALWRRLLNTAAGGYTCGGDPLSYPPAKSFLPPLTCNLPGTRSVVNISAPAFPNESSLACGQKSSHLASNLGSITEQETLQQGAKGLRHSLSFETHSSFAGSVPSRARCELIRDFEVHVKHPWRTNLSYPAELYVG